MTSRCDRTRRVLLGGLGAACVGGLALDAPAAPLARVQERGTLTVGI